MSMLYYRAKNIAKEKMIKADQGSGCGFCDQTQIHIVAEHQYFWIIQNRMPYDLFDGVPVEDHLMIAPKAHRERIADLTPPEGVEYVELLGLYEAQNYTVYSRGVGNLTRTAGHLHTHLLLLQKDRVSALLYMKSPYFVIHPGRLAQVRKQRARAKAKA